MKSRRVETVEINGDFDRSKLQSMGEFLTIIVYLPRAAQGRGQALSRSGLRIIQEYENRKGLVL